MSKPNFRPIPGAADGTVSWIHIGDPHMTRSGEQNEIDLGRTVDEINALYAHGGVNFVFIPGDIANDGSAGAYAAFRFHLDRLQLPWCAITGDHDVQEKSFDNFRKYIASELYSGFSVGRYRFLRLNAFSIPRPDSFVLDEEQLRWLELELKRCEQAGSKAILFLHCYPSELRQGSEKLRELLLRYPVLLVDMGHTHYNEVSNDGLVLYSATRSTGQIEEGPVGYSLTTVDGDAMSWHFVPIGSPCLVTITQPEDERLLTQRSTPSVQSAKLPVHAKIWSSHQVIEVWAQIGDQEIELISKDGILWTGLFDLSASQDGVYDLQVTANDADRAQMKSSIRLRIGKYPERSFAAIDHENSIGEWRERGLLGTQLGPNKNGKKW